jgi:hypothetical protein
MTYQTITPVKLGQTVMTTGATTLYTVPASTRTFVKDIDIINTDNSGVTFDVYLVPSAGTAGVSNALFYQQPIAAKQTIQWQGTQILNTGDTIQVKASAATSITITASGGEAV